MPIVMTGYVVVPADRLLEHVGHNLTARQSSPVDGSVAILDCINCHNTRDPLELAREYKSTSLYCGCSDITEHAEGMALQDKIRRENRIPKLACVGCYIGDDGLSVHSCAIHPV